MRRSRRASACRRGSTPSGCRNGGAQGRNFWARSASCFPARNRADPKDWRVAMPIDRAEPGVPAPLALAGTYTREVRVGIDRIWENVLDWEHLPALHEVYFDHVRRVETGNLGWRVELTKTPAPAGRWMLLELRIDRANARYCARTLKGDGAGTEIWTLLEALGPQRTAVEVRFYLPERRPERLAEKLCRHPEGDGGRRPGLRSPSAPCANCGSGCRFSSRSTESRSAYSRSRMERLSLTARFAPTGWGRSRTSCRRMASCAAHGIICSISGPA
jgi:hypothetical protein